MRKKNNKSQLRLSMALAFFTAFFLSLSTVSTLAADETGMPCEVLEVSGSAKAQSDAFKKIHFMVLHHANAADRLKLSNWLKANSGTEVEFSVHHRRHKGILYRIAHCFGRGLLLYTDTIGVKARDIIKVNLSAKILSP